MRLLALPPYTSADLRGDLAAGLTVGVVLVPMAMAYAVLAGVPPAYGLYASLVPLLVYPIFGTARHLAIGPVAIDMLIIAAGVGALAAPGTDRYLALALALTVFVGVLQLAMGAARLGWVANLISQPVVLGFTSAAALVIAFSQLGPLLGLELPSSSYVHVLVYEAARAAGDVHLPSLGLGALCVAALLGLPRLSPRVPGPLVVVAAATAAAWGLGLEAEGVTVVGPVPDGLPRPLLPDVGPRDLRALLPTALTLAAVQFLTVVSLGSVFAARHGYRLRPNRELVALGGANVLGGLFRGVAVSGSFSRSAVNERAGARTAFANVAAAGVVAVALLFLTPFFERLPLPALAAIIIVAAIGLLDLGALRRLLRVKRSDGYVALFTLATTLLVGIQEGLLLGVAGSLVMVLYRISNPNVAVLGHLPGTRSFRDVERAPAAEPLPGLLVLRIDAPFTFANAGLVRDAIVRTARRARADGPLDAVVLDGSSIGDLDTTAADALESVVDTLAEDGIAFYLAGLTSPVRDIVRRSGLAARLGAARFARSPHRAVLAHLDAAPDGDARRADYERRVAGRA